MRKWLPLFVLLLCVAAYADTDDSWAFQSKELTIDTKLAGEIKLVPTSTSFAETDFVQAELAFVPLENDRQKTLDFKSVPDAVITNGAITYKWGSPTKNAVLPFYWKATVQTEYGLVRVDEKIAFPLEPKKIRGFEQYVQYTENIDVNEDIRQLANELARGEDDLYDVVYKVSEWLKQNIEYNLDYALTLEKPSQTLESKEGVCDEFTALFVSILRSLNIPTKYVSGYAYTNLKKPSGFGPHAWAEVYFPGVGWIPFDTTYNQFGYVDATHIKLKDSFDSGTYSARYEWRGRNVELESTPLQFTAEVTDVGDKIDQRVSLKASFVKEEAGFGSYNLLEADVTNLNNFYTGITVYASLSDQMEFLDENAKDVLLKPFETKKISWIVKLNSNLDERYQYNIPVKVYLADGGSSETHFISTSKERVYSKAEMVRLQDFAKEDEIVTNEVDIVCTLPENALYVEQIYIITCTLRNAGTVELFDLQVCLEKDCQNVDLGIAQSAKVEFAHKQATAGESDIFVSVQNDILKKSVVLTAQILAHPTIVLEDVVVPSNVAYDDRFRIEFLLHKGAAVPKNVKISITKGDKEVRAWDLPELASDRRFLLDYGGHLLSKGQNIFSLNVNYEDELGKQYSSTQGISITLENVTLAQRAYLISHKLGAGKSSFDMLVYVIFAFAMGGLIGFAIKHSDVILRHKKKPENAHAPEPIAVKEEEITPVVENEPQEVKPEPPKKEPEKKKELEPPKKEAEPTKKEHPASKPKDPIIKEMGKHLNENIDKKFKEMHKKAQ